MTLNFLEGKGNQLLQYGSDLISVLHKHVLHYNIHYIKQFTEYDSTLLLADNLSLTN